MITFMYTSVYDDGAEVANTTPITASAAASTPIMAPKETHLALLMNAKVYIVSHSMSESFWYEVH
jgi:hypothetical protein